LAKLRLATVSCGQLRLLIDDSADCAALLASCAQESTGADRVVRALARASLEWLADRDVKRLRSTLLRVVADLD
jgi:hypothetical protein